MPDLHLTEVAPGDMGVRKEDVSPGRTSAVEVAGGVEWDDPARAHDAGEVFIIRDHRDIWTNAIATGFFRVAPELKALRNREEFVLRWPAAATNYVLQTAEHLSADTPWRDSTEGAILSGSDWVVTNRVSGLQQFYRLKRADAQAPISSGTPLP